MWQQVFDKIDELSSKYLQVWKEVCDIESPTSCKEGVDAASAYMVRIAEQYGWSVEYNHQPFSGDCVCITVNPDSPDRPVALSGHMDTVHPLGSFGPTPTRVEGDKIYGPGVEDCKGGVVAAFLAAAALWECGFRSRPILILLQSDEEVSSITSNKETVTYMGKKAKNCAAFLNAEGHSFGSLVIERKGIQRYVFDVRGRAAHSSTCYQGASAVLEAAHKIIALEKYKDKDGITCNCSMLNGGSTPNSVPDTCSFIADFRYKTAAQLIEVEAIARRVAETSFVEGVTCVLSEKSHRICMERCETNEKLFNNIRFIFEKCNLPAVEPVVSRGGSDAADMTALGIPCLDGFGVRGGNCHSRQEFAYVDSLAESAKMMASVILCI